VMKALEKDRTRRYDTAADLGQDVQRHLAGEAVQAAPPSAGYKVRKFVRRNKGLVAAAGAVGAAVVLGVVGMALTTRWALREKENATQSKLVADQRQAEARAKEALANDALVAKQAEQSKARRAAYINALRSAQAALNKAEFTRAREQLNACPGSERGIEWRSLLCDATGPAFQLPSYAGEFFPDGRRVLASPDSGSSYSSASRFICDRTTGKTLVELQQSGSYLRRAVVRPDGREVLAAGYGQVMRWNAEDGSALPPLSGIGNNYVQDASYSPDGRRVVSAGGDAAARLWTVDPPKVVAMMTGHDGVVTSARFSGDGTRIVTGSYDGTARLWDGATGDRIRAFSGHTAGVRSAEFDRTGARVLTQSDDFTARLWDTASGECVKVLDGGETPVKEACFSRDGKLIFARCERRSSLLVFDASTGEEAYRFPSGDGPVWSFDQSAAGGTLVTRSWRTVRGFDTSSGRPLFGFSVAEGNSPVKISPDASMCFVGNLAYHCRADAGMTHDAWIGFSARASDDTHWRNNGKTLFAPAGQAALVGGIARSLELINAETGVSAARLGLLDGVLTKLFNASGTRVLLTIDPWVRRQGSAPAENRPSAQVHLLDAVTGKPVGPGLLEARALPDGNDNAHGVAAFSNDGKLAATVTLGRGVDIWNAEDGTLLVPLRQASQTQLDLTYVSFSAEDGCVVAQNAAGIGVVWNRRSGQEIARIRPTGFNEGDNAFVAFAKQGDKVFVSVPHGEPPRILSTRPGAAGTDAGHGGPQSITLSGDAAIIGLTSGWFSADGSRFVGRTRTDVHHVWYAEGEKAGEEVIADKACSELNNAVDVTECPKSRVVAATLKSGSVALFSLDDGTRIGEMPSEGTALRFQAFSADEHWMVISAEDGTLQIWRAGSHGVERARVVLRLATQAHASCAALSPDGAKLAVFWATRGWLLDTRKPDASPTELLGASGAGFRLRFTDDGSRIIAESQGKVVSVWRAADGSTLPPKGALPAGAVAIEYSPDLSRVAAGTLGGGADLLDALTGRRIRELWREARPAAVGAASRDARVIVTANRAHCRPQLFDGRTGMKTARLGGHDAGVRAAAITPDGTIVVTGSDDTTVFAWDAGTGSPVGRFRGHKSSVGAVAVNAAGTLAASGADDGSACLWRVADGAPRVADLSGHTSAVLSTAFCDDGSKVLTVSADSARLWDGTSGAPLCMEMRHAGASSITCAAMSPDGAIIATCAEDRSLRLWDGRNGKLLTSDIRLGAIGRMICFGLGGSRLLIGTEGGPLEIRRSDTGDQVGVLRGHSDLVAAAAYTRNGDRIITAARDFTLRVWDPRDGAELHTMASTGTDPFINLWVSADDRWVVTLTKEANGVIRDLEPEQPGAFGSEALPQGPAKPPADR